MNSQRTPDRIHDPAHGHTTPTGRRLATALRGVFLRQRREGVAALGRGQLPDFDPWTLPMVEVLTPLALAHWRTGVERVARQASGTKGVQLRRGAQLTKAMADLRQPGFLSRIAELCRQAVYFFCRSANATSTKRVRVAVEEARQADDPQVVVKSALASTFGSERAADIGMTEAHRSEQMGQLEAAKESKVIVATTWRAAANACPKCKELDGTTVPLGTPFLTGGGAYGDVFCAPLHPHCRCVHELVYNDEQVAR